MTEINTNMPARNNSTAHARAQELHGMLVDVAEETGFQQFNGMDLQAAERILSYGLNQGNKNHSPVYQLHELTGNIEGVTSTDVIPTLFVHDDVIRNIVNGNSGLDWDVHFRRNICGDSYNPQNIMASVRVSEAGTDLSYSYGSRELFIHANRLHEDEYKRLRAWNSLNGRDADAITPRWNVYAGFVIPEIHYTPASMKTISSPEIPDPVLPEDFVDVVFEGEKLFNQSRKLIYAVNGSGANKVTIDDYVAFFDGIRAYESSADGEQRLLSPYVQERMFTSYCEQVAAAYSAFIDSSPAEAHGPVRTARNMLKGMVLRQIQKKDTEENLNTRVEGILVSNEFITNCVAKTFYDTDNGCEKVAFTLENNDADVSSVTINIAPRIYMTVGASSIKGANWVHLLSIDSQHSQEEAHQFIQQELKA